jgi:hypothetical protein
MADKKVEKILKEAPKKEKETEVEKVKKELDPKIGIPLNEAVRKAIKKHEEPERKIIKRPMEEGG